MQEDRGYELWKIAIKGHVNFLVKGHKFEKILFQSFEV